ncbi:MAG: aminoacyl-tRNA hydrolase [Muribaculaceae bacterium]|nr:aminoacyl-tRNA hydrolase [Muribaculaceae bacterium]
MNRFLIVGLGNPGPEYRDTRHNIGFRIITKLAEEYSAEFINERYALRTTVKIKNCELILIKPLTYMNLSGNAVRYWMDKEKIPVNQILIVVDDLALPFGAIRIKASGSDAGHNGLKDIAAKIGTSSYPRLRFGIGDDFSRGHQADFVLGAFTLDERQKLPVRIETAVDAIRAFCLSGIDFAMCNYNNK